MRVLARKLQTIPYVIAHINKSINGEASPFELLSQAPLWLRLVSRGRYCAYRNVIYVPSFHLELVSSKYEADRTLATAKLLPWVMLLHDVESVSLLTALKSLFYLPYQLHYFLYEFLFLKATNHKFFEVISMGFMTTRSKWFGMKKLSYEDVELHMRVILDLNKPKN
jgi:hypothetical protein